MAASIHPQQVPVPDNGLLNAEITVSARVHICPGSSVHELGHPLMDGLGYCHMLNAVFGLDSLEHELSWV